jgi:hypothetical protein
MKKIAVLAIVSMLFLGCGQEYYTVLITNNSTKTVKYTYNGIDDTLNTSTSKTYEVKAYTQPPQNIIDNNGIASIKMERRNDTITFTDATSLNLKVLNKLPVALTIKADNYIANNTSTELTISANAENTSAKIYTRNPRFTATTTSNAHYAIKYTVKIDGNDMSVTIE